MISQDNWHWGYCWQFREDFGNLCEGASIKVCLNDEDLPQTATILLLWVGEDGKEKMLVDIYGKHVIVDKKDCRQRLRIREKPLDVKVDAWMVNIDLTGTPIILEVEMQIDGRFYKRLCNSDDWVYRANVPLYAEGSAGWYWQFREKGCGNVEKGVTVMVPTRDLRAHIPDIPDKQDMMPATVEYYIRQQDENGEFVDFIHVLINNALYRFKKKECCQIVKIYSRIFETEVDGWLVSFDSSSETVLVRYQFSGYDLRTRIPIVDVLRR